MIFPRQKIYKFNFFLLLKSLINFNFYFSNKDVHKKLERKTSSDYLRGEYKKLKKMRKEQNELVIKFFDGIIGREEFKQSYYELENKIKRKMDDSLRYRYHKIKRLKRLKENNI